MQAWWNSLSLLGQVFATIAIPATVLMVIQAILLMVGFGSDHDTDFDSGDSDVEGLSLVTIRGLIAFFSVGGWTGLVLSSTELPTVLTILISFIAGTLALVGIALLFKYSLKLQDKGNLEINNAIGKIATVYIPIPKLETGHGKITLLLQERLVELNAVTCCEDDISTGAIVVITGLVDEQTVIVENHKENNKKLGGISKWVQK